MSLFREEVLRNRADRLQGDVSLALPLSWQAIGFLLLAALVVAIGFLSLASYARTETVAGAIVTDRGVAAIVPTRPGIVTDVAVRDGQRVERGMPQASIGAEETMVSGGTAQEQVLAALARQDIGLAGQSGALLAAAAADRARIQAQAVGLTQEIAGLEAQIGVQRNLVASAKTEFERAGVVAERGFISRRDLQVREEQYLGRIQQLSQLEGALASKRAAIVEGERAGAQISAAARAQAAGVASSRAELSQQLAGTEASRAYVLTSPIAGRVTALTARAGQPATQQQPLMTIVPARSRLRAELYVPTGAAGFLAAGQEVRRGRLQLLLLWTDNLQKRRGVYAPRRLPKEGYCMTRLYTTRFWEGFKEGVKKKRGDDWLSVSAFLVGAVAVLLFIMRL